MENIDWMSTYLPTKSVQFFIFTYFRKSQKKKRTLSTYRYAACLIPKITKNLKQPKLYNFFVEKYEYKWITFFLLFFLDKTKI